ncbi:MAG: hypothetical protein ACI35W_04005 [Anaeroplasmataceae bacterium]
MIPEEVILNAAENINTNLARLTDLEVRFNGFLKFGRRLEPTTGGSFETEDELLDEVFNFFYENVDDTSDIASAQVGINSYIFVKSRYLTSRLIMLDTTSHKFYDVDNSTGTYTKTTMFYGKEEVGEDIATALEEFNNVLTKYIDAQDANDQKYADGIFNNAIAHANSLFDQINNRLNAITEGADTDYDTFKELSDQIKKFKEEHSDFLDSIDRLTTKTLIDSETTSIVRTLSNNTDYSYTAEDIASITFKIPADITHGYTAGVNYKIGTTRPGFSLINNSTYPLRIIENGRISDSVTHEPNHIYSCIVICNGLEVIFQVVEMEVK